MNTRTMVLVCCGFLFTSFVAAQDVDKDGGGGVTVKQKIIGMYVHQHWGYNHPYAARTWTLEDWEGYLEGLYLLGYNTVLIWPVLETMPNPLTESDKANIEKIARVIDIAHTRFNMAVYLTISPNAAAKSEEAGKYTFQERPFFYCDYRVDPGDAGALGDLIRWREQLFRPLAAMDGLIIIDSDPGGYPGSTHVEFVYLLNAHRKMLDRLRKGIELVYWIHVGWEAYCRFYATAEFAMGPDEEIEETIRLLAHQNPEPWGLTGGRPNIPMSMGYGDRTFAFLYGAIEGEPSFPMTIFGTDTAYQAGKNAAPRGGMGNSQTHCLQLPNTFAFVRGAKGLPLTEGDYVRFAEDLLPGRGKTVVEGWSALASANPEAMDSAAQELEKLHHLPLTTGPLRGLLFGDPARFVRDLVEQLRANAALERFHAAVFAESQDTFETRKKFRDFIEAIALWQERHGYKNNWVWPRMEEVLLKLDPIRFEKIFAQRNYRGEGATPFEQVQNGYRNVESFTPDLIQAMRESLASLGG